MWKRLIVSTVAWLTVSAQSFSQTPPTGVSSSDSIAARQAAMDMSSITLRSMAAAINGDGEAKAQGYPAAALAKWAKVVPRMFPVGTSKDDLPDNTQALLAIWQDRDGFQRAASNYATATVELAALAKANNTREFARQLLVVDQSCRSCHTHYKDGMLPPPLEVRSR